MSVPSHAEVSARGGRARSDVKRKAVLKNLARAKAALTAKRAARKNGAAEH